MHRRNASERDIMTRKKHFVSIISGTDRPVPMHIWDIIMDQAQITLNMLRPSRRNPNISAHEMMEGNFYFNKKLLAPPGTKFIVHEKTIEGAHAEIAGYKDGT